MFGGVPASVEFAGRSIPILAISLGTPLTLSVNSVAWECDGHGNRLGCVLEAAVVLARSIGAYFVRGW